MFPGRSRSWGCWVSGRGGVFGGPESGGGPWLHRLFGCEEQTGDRLPNQGPGPAPSLALGTRPGAPGALYPQAQTP